MSKDNSAGRKAPRTKTGCWTCRERKVRCDEGKPICTNCSRLGLGCAGYGARITFRDDTPRVIQRMESVTDVQGCSVYDGVAGDRRRPGTQGLLRYTTYTPSYFEKHKDIEIETDLLDASSQVDTSPPNAYSQYPPFLSDSRSGYANAPYPASQTYNTGQNYLYTPSTHDGQESLWAALPSPQYSPLPPNASQYQFSRQLQGQAFAQVSGPPDPQYPTFSLTRPVGHQMRSEALSNLQPQKGVHSTVEHTDISVITQPRPQSLDSTSAVQELTPISLSSSVGNPSPAPNVSHFVQTGTSCPGLLIPPANFNSRRSSDTTSDTDRLQHSPSSLKWAEHFGGDHTIKEFPETKFQESEIDPARTFIPEDLLGYVRRLVPGHQDANDNEAYLRHYLVTLAGQLAYPDRGRQNPFRMLLYDLCPREPALLHAVLSYAATDLAHNDPDIDCIRAFSQAQLHYNAAMQILQTQLEDEQYEQSTAALTTAYFLDLIDVKNVRPISQTHNLLRIVKARSAAGKIYEGGICWTWYHATLGVLSALFGGPVVVMPYLIESDQLPTPGQGNMFSFIKKTESERIEHTVISPMYISQFETWVLLSKLTLLANGYAVANHENVEFRTAVIGLKQEMETSWNSRAKLIDSLTSDVVEDVFITKWKQGVPAAQQVVATHHGARLYAELLLRGLYTQEELQVSVKAIMKIFQRTCATGSVFQRRVLLIPVFLCAIICPEFSYRKQIIKKLAQSVCTEPSWNKALEVVNSLLKEEMMAMDVAGVARGYGSTRWHEVRDRLGGIVLY